ncbi:MAG: hypothetical protein MI922_07480 [Bacteroidales bacterium]|nr:hypothetical protein [Bacteroidales bacterium]
MELDELKDVWNKVPADSQKEFTKEDIQSGSKDHSKNMMVNVRKRFLIENGIGVAIFIIGYIGIIFLRNQLVINLFTLLFGVSFIYFAISLYQIQTLIRYNESLKEFIEKSIRLIKIYQLISKLIVITVCPFITALGFFMGIKLKEGLNTLSETLIILPLWIPIVVSISITVIIYIGNHAVYNRIYGKPLNYLKGELKKLETNTNK